MLLYRLNSDLGTFLVNPEMRVYDPRLKGVKFYSDKENFSKWILISLYNASCSLGGNISSNELLETLNYIMEVYEVHDSLIPDVIESCTFNGNVKKEYMLHANVDVTLLETCPIREVEDWDKVFPSHWRS